MDKMYNTVVFLQLLMYSGASDTIKSYVSSTYDWDSRSSSVSATCVNIPKNLTLCNNIGYDKMRLPNLLEHDTLSEVSQQAASWVPLLNVRCHPDTQRFICSLFCPVCLDHSIYPCRSLCEKVKAGCEIRMKMYGFPWPEMFACSSFPEDNDMCISSETVSNSSSDEKCKICEQVNTVENVLDYYCQSAFAVRGKFRKYQNNLFIFKKIKLFKATNDTKKEFNGELFHFNLTEECCREKLKVDHTNYFIMGNYENKRLIPTFIMPWVVKRSKSFKKSIKMLKTINCTNPDDITHTVIQPTSVPLSPAATVRNERVKPPRNKTQAARPKAKKNQQLKLSG